MGPISPQRHSRHRTAGASITATQPPARYPTVGALMYLQKHGELPKGPCSAESHQTRPDQLGFIGHLTGKPTPPPRLMMRHLRLSERLIYLQKHGELHMGPCSADCRSGHRRIPTTQAGLLDSPAASYERFKYGCSGAIGSFCSAKRQSSAATRGQRCVVRGPSTPDIRGQRYLHSARSNSFTEASRAPYGPMLG